MSSSSMFDDSLLQDFMDKFYGYGNYQGDYWFVGMEEGGGGSFADIAQRLQDWNRRGRLELEDIVAYHAEIGAERFFGSQPRLQPTWNRLIRIELSARGEEVHTEYVRAYQKDYLGRHSSTNCLVELLPLPSPSVRNWLYAQYSQLPYLTNREVYASYYAERRAAHLRQRIREYKPKAVIFYSVNPGYIHWWKVIADVEFMEIVAGDERLYVAKNENTVFAITRHPVAKGVKNEYFHQVGKIVASSFLSQC
ncbi:MULTISPECIES: hypothetical protein [Aerosakkonema]|uniref:hypothetical protein n=1 Tax=Aerosakkonema TaxID=1246629 RepID=UPI0035B8C787